MKQKRRFFTSLLAIVTLLALLTGCAAAAPGSKGENAANDAADGGYDYLYGNIMNGNGDEIEEDAALAPEASSPDIVPGGDNPQQPSYRENPFMDVEKAPVSTFSADVDTASYAYFRKLVQMGADLNSLINASSAFRTEEFINYFRYDVAQPAEGELFGVDSAIIPCPWNSENLLLRLTLQAENAVEPKGNNLVFLIDVSGSMNSSDKLELLKTSFEYLVSNLTPMDTVSIVTYSGKEEVVLDGCSGNDSAAILNAIRSLKAGGSTNGQAGLTEAYRIAEKHMVEGGNNRIIMASDGDLNVGISSAEELKSFVEEKRGMGVYLSVLGFGTGNYRDAQMEALADNGNGVYYYIDGETEAEKVFGTDLLGTLYTVAEDVKLQITFDPAYVSSYRLIGYENRILNTEDFNDDTKDAGDVGAGHQVTVCYELAKAADAPEGNDWMKLAVRYKNPGETISQLNEYAIGAQQFKAEADEDMKFLTGVIETVMLLHRSEHLKNATIVDILEKLNALDLANYPEREEFCDLIRALANQK